MPRSASPVKAKPPSVPVNVTDESRLPLGDVLEFMRVIWQLDHALQRMSKRMEATLGVTGPQRLVMRIVGRFPGIPAGQLAKLLHLHPSTLTGILKRLERQGLLRRRADPEDGRRFLFGLTDKGRSFDVLTQGTVEASVAQSLEHTPASKLAAARGLLEDIASRLDMDNQSDASSPRRASVPARANATTRRTASNGKRPRRIAKAAEPRAARTKAVQGARRKRGSKR